MPSPRRVLVTAGCSDPGGMHAGPRVRPIRPTVAVAQAVVEAVRSAGGLPLIVPPGSRVQGLLEGVAAVVVTGGGFDIHPSHYGHAVRGRLDAPQAARTATELDLVRACLGAGVPVLGLCGGLQALAVAAGGTLIQDLATERPGCLEHEQPTDPASPWHGLRVAPGWTHLLPDDAVNSTHHQAVDHPGALEVIAWAPDGVVEAAALRGHPFALGVQWHPETLGRPLLFQALLEAAR